MATKYKKFNFACFTIVAGIMHVVLVTSAGYAQSQNPAWLDELALDLAVDHQCEVVEYLEMREGKIGARNTYFAKVRCKDGREFDASKIEPAEAFSIRLCEVVTC